ncbi:MAG TPA: helix-turn-helix domain-containing protein [Pirellulales bacterium]
MAADCGFTDQSSFTQHFRRYVGVTPNRYRKPPGARLKPGQEAEEDLD